MTNTHPEQNPAPVSQLDDLTSTDLKVIKSLTNYLEQINFVQFVETRSNTKKLLWLNFLSGTARGFGYIVGATLLIGWFWLIIEWLGGLPWIGQIIAQIIEIVKQQEV